MILWSKKQILIRSGLSQSIKYGEDDNETLSPIIKTEYSTAGSNTIITGYGKIEFEFYKDKNLTEVVSRNIFGHYDVPEAAENGQSIYYIGITCTEGENIKAQTDPVLLSEINVSRAQYTSVDVTCDNIRYGETPSPNASLKNIDSTNEYTADGTARILMVHLKSGKIRTNLENGM